PELVLGFLGPQPLQLEVLPHPLDWIALRPRLDLVLRPVPRRVVARGVRAHTVGDRLNHRGAAAAPRLVRRRPRDGVDREEIVPIYTDAVEAVRQGLLSEGLRGGLAGDRNRDCTLVVLAEEDRRRLEDARKVPRGMAVAVARRAVPEGRQRDDVVLPHLRSARRSYRPRDLRSHGPR